MPNTKRFACEMEGCDKVYTSMNSLRGHMGKKHGGEAITCACGKKCFDRSNFNRHRRDACPLRVKDKPVFYCAGCMQACIGRKDNAKRHFAKCEKGGKEFIDGPIGESIDTATATTTAAADNANVVAASPSLPNQQSWEAQPVAATTGYAPAALAEQQLQDWNSGAPYNMGTLNPVLQTPFYNDFDLMLEESLQDFQPQQQQQQQYGNAYVNNMPQTFPADVARSFSNALSPSARPEANLTGVYQARQPTYHVAQPDPFQYGPLDLGFSEPFMGAPDFMPAVIDYNNNDNGYLDVTQMGDQGYPTPPGLELIVQDWSDNALPALDTNMSMDVDIDPALVDMSIAPAPVDAPSAPSPQAIKQEEEQEKEDLWDPVLFSETNFIDPEFEEFKAFSREVSQE